MMFDMKLCLHEAVSRHEQLIFHLALSKLEGSATVSAQEPEQPEDSKASPAQTPINKSSIESSVFIRAVA